MNPTTLFATYMAVVLRREYTRDNRGTGFGIAVKDDVYALELQRLDRLAGKLEKRILADLRQYEYFVRRNQDNARLSFRMGWQP